MNKEHREDVKNNDELKDIEEKEKVMDNSKENDIVENAETNVYDEVESLRKALEEANENLLRVKAEADNFRKRLNKEFEEKLKFANQSLLIDFLTFADNLEIALRHVTQGSDESLDKFKEGLQLILKQFKDLLAKHGMKEICCNEGDQFDPNLHDALMLDSIDDMENNTITAVLQKGYTLHDRVVRPTKVKVNKK